MEKQLPKNWVETSPLVISKIIRGVSYGKTDASQVEFDNSCLILRGGNIQDGEIVDGKDNVYVPLDLIKKEQFIQEHDVVIVGSTGSKNLIGKAATSLYNSDKISFGAFLMLIRAFEPIDKRYFSYYFQTNYYREAIRNLAGGVNINNIRKEYIENLYFPLPPLAEQNRIVAKLDTLFAQLETIKASMAKIPVLLKEFRQQVLTQAVTGKLTEEWRKGKELESSETIVSTIIEKRIVDFDLKCKLAKQKGERKPLAPEYFNYSKKDLKMHPIKSWFQSPVGFLCDCIVPGRDKPKDFTGTIPWITTPDLNSDYITSENARLFLSEDEIAEVKAKIIPINSVVISIVGRFGISCVIKSECVINQQLHAYLPSELIVPEYLMFHIRTQGNLMNDLSSSTTIAYINKTKANSIPINVPPIREQQEIVSRVESLFTKADAIEQQYLSVKEKIDTLPQALLHKAFKGELTEQLESDGDARELLQQIQELKNSTVKPNKATSKKVKKYPENETVLGMVAEGK